MTGWLGPAIFTIALVYASVGHAGATGYVAALTLAGLPPDVIRPTALVLNVGVATIATTQFARAGHLRRDLAVPLAVAGVPAAFLGGMLGLPPAAFEAVVGTVLAVSALGLAGRALGLERRSVEPDSRRLGPMPLAILGAGLGLLAGLTGVGGGVFLTPALLALGAAPVREIAAASAAFILVNSLAGLGGGLVAGRSIPPVGLQVVAAALVGGAIGSQLGAFRLPVRALEGLMGLVLAVAAGKLLVPLVTGS
ncbi:MAG: sulfite exporter TauE/SafE family protein [Planctomycetaceae bacterium]